MKSACCIFMHITASLLVSSSAHPSAHAGGSVSLDCLCQGGVEVMAYWYKQALGRSPKLVSTFYKHTDNSVFADEFKSPRFSRGTGDKQLTLRISDLRASDSATFYCVLSDLHEFQFCEGITVSVRGSGSSIQTLVLRSESENVGPEVSESLSCAVHTGSCDGDQAVYWFSNMNEISPGLIYTSGGRNDECEKKSDTQTHTCVYNLPMKVPDAGTFYCAVASCGRILSANRTNLDSEDESESLVSVYVLTAALAVSTILAVLLAFFMYRLSKGHCLHSETSPSKQFSGDGEELHYAVVRDYKARGQKHDTYSTCVYSSVKL